MKKKSNVERGNNPLNKFQLAPEISLYNHTWKYIDLSKKLRYNIIFCVKCSPAYFDVLDRQHSFQHNFYCLNLWVH